MTFIQKLAVAFSAIFPTMENDQPLGDNPTENEVLTFLEKIPNLIQPLSEIKTIQEDLQKVKQELLDTKEMITQLPTPNAETPGITKEEIATMISSAEPKFDATALAQEITNKVYSAMADAKLITLTADGNPIAAPQLGAIQPPKEKPENSTTVTSKELFGKRPSVGNLF